MIVGGNSHYQLNLGRINMAKKVEVKEEEMDFTIDTEEVKNVNKIN